MKIINDDFPNIKVNIPEDLEIVKKIQPLLRKVMWAIRSTSCIVEKFRF